MKPWQGVALRPVTRPIIEQIARGRYSPKIRCIYLFGSEARGAATLTSDIDIALVSDEPLTRQERLVNGMHLYIDIFEQILHEGVVLCMQ